MRILKSVEVDETDAEYVNAKRKATQQLKNTWESIFEKYGNMNESMSDEIDMRTHKIVKDRGHLRRLQRQVSRKETVLLNAFVSAADQEELDEDLNLEQGQDDSEDELAPTQVPKPSSGRRGTAGTVREEGIIAPSAETSSSSKALQTELPTGEPRSNPMAQPCIQHTPSTPNPATNLLQFVQFPQTPAGQQAQKSFYATLAQTINQAVQQAVAPLFSGIFPSTPDVQVPAANQFTNPATPAVAGDRIAPATDKKWYFPPLPAEAQNVEVQQPEALPATGQGATNVHEHTRHAVEIKIHKKHVPQGTYDTVSDRQQPTISLTALVRPEQRTTRGTRATRRTSPRVEIQRRPDRREAKYRFTEEDDIYISRQKVLENRTWPQIKDSREEWRECPVGTFHQRWFTGLRDKNLHLKNLPSVEQSTQDDSQASEFGSDALPSHHLPTPSSLGQEDSLEQADIATPKPLENIMSSNTHFDDHELELLSLAGADLEEDQELPHTTVEEGPFFSDTDDIILPSVESNDSVNEDTLQQGLLDGSPMENTPVDAEADTILVASASKRKQQLNYNPMPDPGDGTAVDHVGSSPSPQPSSHLACKISGAAFKNAKNLQRHQDNHRSTHDNFRPRSASIDLVGDDELQATVSASPPIIKREFSTPPPTSFLFTTPAHQSLSRPDFSSSGFKSTTKVDRRTYLKQVKQSWTAKKASPAPRTIHKRRSLQSVPMKRTWIDDSDDELGM